MTEVKLIRPSTMNYCDIYCDNAMTSTMTLRIGGMQQQRHGTRITQIGRISTDTHYPRASASSAQSVFYRKIAIFDDDNKPQIMAPRVTPLEGASTSTVAPVDVAHTYGSRHTWRDVSMHRGGHNSDERRYFPASNFNKIIHRKGHKERKAHPIISFGIRKTTEGTEDTEKRNKSLCSLCSPWLNNLAGGNFGGFNAHALECSIFTQGEPNDILMSVRAPVGPTNIAKERCCIGRGLAAIRCNEGLSYKYLIWVLRNFEKKISSEGAGSIFDAIGKDEIRAIEFPIPPTPADQFAIASDLESRMAHVEKMRGAALRQKEAVAAMQGAMYPAISNDDVKDFSIPLPPILSDQIAIAAELERKGLELEKARQAAERQLEAIEALTGAILREVFDFEEENTGS